LTFCFVAVAVAVAPFRRQTIAVVAVVLAVWCAKSSIWMPTQQ